MTWTAEIASLAIELLDNGNVRFEDKSYSEGYSVDLHLLHLRFIAEKLGLVREMSAFEADALRTVSKFARRIRLLAERIDHLDDMLLRCSEHAHDDLSWEVSFRRATCDLADEFVREIDESGAVVTPRPQRAIAPAASSRVASPKPVQATIEEKSA